jgi:hypothetical protein
MATYLLRADARTHLLDAHGLKLGETALENMASDGTGPVYVKINGRALYTRESLDEWVRVQASRPVRRRKQRSAEQADARGNKAAA